MRQRRIKPTTILTDGEVGEVVRGVRTVFGDTFATLAESLGLNLEEGVRFMPVAKRCEERRCARGGSVKEVAAQLKVPQYRLKDIEAGHVRRIRPGILHAYLSHLGLASWYRGWARRNPGVARQLAAQPRPRKAQKRGRGRTSAWS
jgi:hypothetical protein